MGINKLYPYKGIMDKINAILETFLSNGQN